MSLPITNRETAKRSNETCKPQQQLTCQLSKVCDEANEMTFDPAEPGHQGFAEVLLELVELASVQQTGQGQTGIELAPVTVARGQVVKET